MRIALVDSSPKPLIYPLPLLKIGAWRKSIGDECELFISRLPNESEFDQIWITTTFTYNIPHSLGMVREAKKRAVVVKVGGVAASLIPAPFEALGVDVHRGLLEDAEGFAPDYSLLKDKPKYSISHTSRGCLRKCGFCMVHKLEPKFKNRVGWESDLCPGATKVLFYDNNWLAKKKDQISHDVEALKGLSKKGIIKEIDFNQGLDARLMTPEIADIIKGLPIRPVRFAFDGMHEDGYYQRAVRMVAERGFRDITTYMLYNYQDTPQDFYYRLRETVVLRTEIVGDIASFPMRYQPILEVNKDRDYVGSAWTLKKARGVNAILGKHSVSGRVSCRSIKEFEYWFGKDAEEFNKLLSYPKLRTLMDAKRGYLRAQRSTQNSISF